MREFVGGIAVANEGGPQGLKRVLKKYSDKTSVPQRLKPHCKGGTYGTGKPVPLSKTEFFSTL